MTVKLFANLRRIAGARELQVPARTVREALEGLCRGNSELSAAIFDEEHGIRPHVRIMINGRAFEFAQGLDTRVGADDEIAIFPPIGGGNHLGGA